MNRMIRLFQKMSNQKFDEWLLAKKKSDWVLGDSHALCLAAVLKAQSDCWARAADLLRKEEANK